MVVFNQRIKGDLARLATDSDHGKFAREGHKTLDNDRQPRQSFLRDLHFLRSPQNPLTLAVVAHPPRLHHRRQTHLFQRLIEVGSRRDRSILRRRNSQLLEQLLFAKAILCRLQRARRRKNRNMFCKEMRRVHGHVFKFVSHNFQAVSKFLESHAIRKIARDAGSNSSYGSFRRRIEKTESQPKRITCKGQHVTKLSATEDPDAHAGFLFFIGFRGPFFLGRVPADGSEFARTRPVCAARNLRSASRICEYLFPRIAAASSAALIAPALPIASVPTGMPPGICAMERSESRPFKAFDSTGTPSTGSTVFEAVMPGK